MLTDEQILAGHAAMSTHLLAKGAHGAAQAFRDAVAELQLDKPVAGFGLSEEQRDTLLAHCGKSDEIAGSEEVQYRRVRELLHWFARYFNGHANPKWLREHAAELAHYVATEAHTKGIDLRAITDKYFKQGANLSDSERRVLISVGAIVRQNYDDALAAQAEAEWAKPAATVPGARGITDKNCLYMATEGKACNKCGKVHRGSSFDALMPPKLDSGWISIQWTGENLRDVTVFLEGKEPDTRCQKASDQWDDYCRIVKEKGLSLVLRSGTVTVPVGTWIAKREADGIIDILDPKTTKVEQ